MIRFSPDNWLEAVLRPFTMALPQAWIYTEIIAPDMRFMILILLCVTWVLLRVRRQPAPPLPVQLRILLVLIAASFPVWLATGGNGRYFMPIILLVGPVMVGVWHALPLRGGTKWLIMAVFAAMQFAAIATNPPWQPFHSLEWVRWRGPHYFDLDTAAVANDRGVTYVTLAGQTNSLVAPLFPADSHWINLSSFQGQDFLRNPRPVVAQARRRLQSARDLRLLVRSQPRQAALDSGLPNDAAKQVLDGYLQGFGMRLSSRGTCKLLPSATFATMTLLMSSDTPASASWLKAHAGFWACPLEWAPVSESVAVSQSVGIPSRVDQAFRKVESLCSRLFPPGQTVYRRADFGYERGYAESESNIAYVRTDDRLYVKMDRTLNPQLIGTVEEILRPNFHLDCGGFTGREGLPWLRSI